MSGAADATVLGMHPSRSEARRPIQQRSREVRPRVATAARLLPPPGIAVWVGGIPWSLVLGIAGAVGASEYYRLVLGGPAREAWPGLAHLPTFLARRRGVLQSEDAAGAQGRRLGRAGR
jgi:hypothetical protein